MSDCTTVPTTEHLARALRLRTLRERVGTVSWARHSSSWVTEITKVFGSSSSWSIETNEGFGLAVWALPRVLAAFKAALIATALQPSTEALAAKALEPATSASRDTNT